MHTMTYMWRLKLRLSSQIQTQKLKLKHSLFWADVSEKKSVEVSSESFKKYPSSQLLCVLWLSFINSLIHVIYRKMPHQLMCEVKQFTTSLKRIFSKLRIALFLSEKAQHCSTAAHHFFRISKKFNIYLINSTLH